MVLILNRIVIQSFADGTKESCKNVVMLILIIFIWKIVILLVDRYNYTMI